MRQVKIGPEGIRGRVDSGLDLEQVIDLVGAFTTWLDEGDVVLCRDTRPSSPMLAAAVTSAVVAAGRDCLDVEVCPTAVAQHEAARLGAAGLVSVTGAHNGASWNGLKLYGAAGRILSRAEGREVLDLWHQEEFDRARHDGLGAHRLAEGALDRYLDSLAGWVDVELIRAAQLKVVVDGCNGAAATAVAPLAARLGFEVVPLSCEATGLFPHSPDPTGQALASVAALVLAVGAHVGFGLGSDCERLGLVASDGEILGREATLALAADHLLSRAGTEGAPHTVVAGVICDSRVQKVAARHGARLARCGVGALAVAEQVSLEDALLGGDNSGGVLVPGDHHALDGLATMARLLEATARAGDSLSLSQALPRVHAAHALVTCPMQSAYSAVEEVRARAEGDVSDQDGVLVELGEDRWYHVRVSHTEPVIRITCEGADDEDRDDLIARILADVRRALPRAERRSVV